MTDDASTPFLSRVRAKLLIDLPPAATRDVKKGVRDHLLSLLLKYQQSFDGVLLGYDAESILLPVAPLDAYFSYLRVTVQAIFSVFQPREGQVMLGTVNKLGADFIGVLVLGNFNATIARYHVRRDLISEEIDGCWRSKANPRHEIRVGTQLRFVVKQVVLSPDHFSMLGSLEEPWTGNMDHVPSPPPPQPPAVGHGKVSSKEKKRSSDKESRPSKRMK